MKHPIRLAVALIALGVFVAIAYVMLADNGQENDSLGTFPVPEPGKTESRELADGQPVFVSTDLDGSVAVVAAISTHLSGDPMAWCPKSRTIDDVPHGGRFDVRGRYLAGPGVSDLGSYAIEVRTSGTEVVVVSFLEPQGRSTDVDHPITEWCDDGGYELHPWYATD